MFLDNIGIPFICFKTKSIYFFNLESNMWQKLEGQEFDLGFLGIVGKSESTIQNSIQNINNVKSIF